MAEGKIQYPAKVKAGYVLLKIGSILLFVFASLILAVLILVIVASVTNPGSVTYTVESVANLALNYVIVGFYILAGIAGLNYASHRKGLVWVVAFAAFFFLFIFLFRVIVTIVHYAEGKELMDDIVDIIVTFFTQTIYFVGWQISKDYFED